MEPTDTRGHIEEFGGSRAFVCGGSGKLSERDRAEIESFAAWLRALGEGETRDWKAWRSDGG